MPQAAYLAPAPVIEAPLPETEERSRSFLRMVSHELRTPLNSIIGFSEIMGSELHGPLGAPQYQEYAGIIRASGHKLLKLVNQVMEIARLVSGAVDFEPGPESIEAAVDDAVAGLRDEMAVRGVSVVLADRGRLPLTLADSRGLRSVLGHLLQNAVQHSPEGGEVRIGVGGGARVLEIRISNDGEPIRSEDLPRLLLPFEQGENALTRRSEGAGLGLPISLMTCKAMGGSLRLTSGPDVGVTAHVRLPRA